jgi:hypothetical protein
MKLLLACLLFVTATVSAQFQFFEQMFGGGGHQQQQQPQQNSASDSEWYQKNWEAGTSPLIILSLVSLSVCSCSCPRDAVTNRSAALNANIYK